MAHPGWGSARAGDKGLIGSFKCDRTACIAALPGGGRMVLARKGFSPGFACAPSDIVVAPAGAASCGGRVYSSQSLERTGPVALYRETGGWREVPTRNPKIQRPWMEPVPPPADVPDATRGLAEDAGS